VVRFICKKSCRNYFSQCGHKPWDRDDSSAFYASAPANSNRKYYFGTELGWQLNLFKKAAEIATMSEAYDLEVNPLARVEDLPVGTQQRVEILKALYRQAKVLILDEPTAVLTPPEIESLFKVLRQLAASNHTIIFISHKLEEVIQLCNTVTVLRREKS
jgi:simple sugar transport system ATP-binding protein